MEKFFGDLARTLVTIGALLLCPWPLLLMFGSWWGLVCALILLAVAGWLFWVLLRDPTYHWEVALIGWGAAAIILEVDYLNHVIW